MFPVVFLLAFGLASAADEDNLWRLDWLKGHWRAERGGHVSWPTIPSKNYAEDLLILESPEVSRTTGIKTLSYSARSWATGELDHMHDEWGYIAINGTGVAALMTSGNNGFNKFEVGQIYSNEVTFKLEDIYRIEHVRDLPVKNSEREFKYDGSYYLTQTFRMASRDHPDPKDSSKTLIHATVYYTKVEEEEEKMPEETQEDKTPDDFTS